jgi:hypothetical protein
METPTGTPPFVKLLPDEMHAPRVAEDLGACGCDVIAVAAEPNLRGLPDTDIMAHAAHTGRTIVTENLADFSILANTWATRGESHSGIVFTEYIDRGSDRRRFVMNPLVVNHRSPCLSQERQHVRGDFKW